jgi:hypothetical protein
VAFFIAHYFSSSFLFIDFPIADFNPSVVNATFVDNGAIRIGRQIIARRIKKKAARTRTASKEWANNT